MSDFDVFNQIVQQAQRQDSLTEQLADLISVATLLGMYDAADWIQNQIAAPARKDISAQRCPMCNHRLRQHRGGIAHQELNVMGCTTCSLCEVNRISMQAQFNPERNPHDY